MKIIAKYNNITSYITKSKYNNIIIENYNYVSAIRKKCIVLLNSVIVLSWDIIVKLRS